MLKLLILAALLLLPAPAAADDWTTADSQREAIYLTLLTVDYKQTLAIPDRCASGKYIECAELNPILGKYPSKDKVGLYFAGTALLHYVIVDTLPPEYRKAFQYLTIGFQGVVVAHNYSVGIKVKF